MRSLAQTVDTVHGVPLDANEDSNANGCNSLQILIYLAKSAVYLSIDTSAAGMTFSLNQRNLFLDWKKINVRLSFQCAHLYVPSFSESNVILTSKRCLLLGRNHRAGAQISIRNCQNKSH